MYAAKRVIDLISVLLLALFPMVGAETISPKNGYPEKSILPGSVPLQEYERTLYEWLMTRQYKKLHWRRDKTVRDTGPFINTQYYGTHPTARIYYSPEVSAWLKRGRKGELPDGSIIVKEMFKPPAALYQEMARNPKYKGQGDYEKFIDSMVFAWTVMVVWEVNPMV